VIEAFDDVVDDDDDDEDEISFPLSSNDMLSFKRRSISPPPSELI
jgi:hypothetical protein